ncbi:MAG: type I polyketide synthase [Vicinamibacterales bacterium]
MSGDGTCKTFDARADGFGRGEGCGAVVLKRLADALSAGDRILAVVRGTSVNQDGHSTLLAAPHGPAQVDLIRAALDNGRVEPSRIGYVEAHGTGTALGDPIEVEAVAAAVGRTGIGGPSCYLGALKSNIGHLEAAAGVMGLIKAVLAIRHATIPPVAGFTALNPHIDLRGTRLVVPTSATPWPSADQPRCAGVSSFGVGGTNAHVVLEEAPRLQQQNAAATAPDRACLLPLSAHTPAALSELAARWGAWVSREEVDVQAACAAAACRRSHLDERVAVVGGSTAGLVDALQAFGRGDETPAVLRRRAASIGDAPRLAFVFSGQGPQWCGMGRELLRDEPVFAAVLRDCDALLAPMSGWSLVDELLADESASRLDRTDVVQPLLVALQVSLVALLRDWGVRPAGVVGHSVGEIAALHTAGVLSLADTMRIAWHRGRLMHGAHGAGRMASFAASEPDVRALIASTGRVDVAAVNGPRTVVVSGDDDAVSEVFQRATEQGWDAAWLPVSYAFHSAQMDPFQSAVPDALGTLDARSSDVPVYSTLTGARVADGAIDARYFGESLRRPVRFADAVGAMAGDGFDAFVEIGPHPVLTAALEQCLERVEPRPLVLGSLRRRAPERARLLTLCGELYVAGASLEWAAIVGAANADVSLPAYPWQRTRHWTVAPPRPRGIGQAFTGHPILGRRVLDSDLLDEVVFESGVDEAPWLLDHELRGVPLMPAAAVLEAFAAAGLRASGEPRAVGAFAFDRPFALRDPETGAANPWRIVVRRGDAGGLRAQLLERERSHATSWRVVADADLVPFGDAGTDVPSGPTHTASADDLYARFHALGASFGPAFRLLTDLRTGDAVAEASLAWPEGDDAAARSTLIDAALQLCSAAAGAAAEGQLLVPVSAARFELTSVTSARVTARARVRPAHGGLSADVMLDAGDGTRIATGLDVRFIPAPPSTSVVDVAPLLHEIRWIDRGPVRNAADTAARGRWVIFEDASGVGGALASWIDQRAGGCVRVRAGRAFSREEGVWTIDPLDRDHMRRLWEEIGKDEAPARIVHLWSCDVPVFDDRSSRDDDPAALASALHLVQELAARPQAVASVTFVTMGAGVMTGRESGARLRPRASGVWGLASVAAIEHPELHIRVRDLDPDAASGTALVGTCLDDGGEFQTGLREGRRWAPRVHRAGELSAALRAHRLVIDRPGTLDGLDWRAVQRTPLGNGDVRVSVCCAGLNFRDVLVALDRYVGPRTELGAECMGVVIETGREVSALAVGDRVFGLAPGGLATEVVVRADMLSRVPDALGDQEAAGMPVAFLTACYGLVRLAALQSGESVLIHAAAGGVGMAAVQVALARGAHVFATAGSEAKRNVVRALGITEVFDSRTPAFADAVRAATAGRGVDVVLNSVAGDLAGASLRALAPGGRFLEIGKRDILSADRVGRDRPDVRYVVFDLGADAARDETLVPALFAVLNDEWRAGRVAPLPVSVFPVESAEDGFRLMAQARHTGKIVLRMPASPRVTREATYLVTGAFGALGRHAVEWLTARGATHLVLVGRTIDQAGERWTAELEARGVRVRTEPADVTDRARMSALLADVSATMPPLRGIVHAAGALADGVLLRQTWETARTVLAAKADGAWLLHLLTRERPLDFFIVYSAAGLWFGAPGQGLYPAANAQVDALVQARRRSGLPGLSVAWGTWGAGMSRGDTGGWTARGLRVVTADDGAAALDTLLASGASHALVSGVDWARFISTMPAGAPRDRFDEVAAGQPALRDAPAPVSALLDSVTRLPGSQRRDALDTAISGQVRHALGLPADAPLDGTRPLREIGLDSLMAVELRNMLARALGRSLPATLLFDHPTTAALTRHLGDLLGLPDGSARPAVPTAPAAPGLSEMSDAEAEALLLAELGTLDVEGRRP